MAVGKLVQINTTTIVSPSATVTLTGIDTDDVYMVTYSNVSFSGAGELFMQVTSGSPATPITSTTYNEARIGLFADTTYQRTGGNQNKIGMSSGIADTTTGSSTSAIIYLYNFNNSSEYNFGIYNTIYRDTSLRSRGFSGGFYQKTAQATNGVHFLNASSVNFTSGTFTLYKVL